MANLPWAIDSSSHWPGFCTEKALTCHLEKSGEQDRKQRSRGVKNREFATTPHLCELATSFPTLYRECFQLNLCFFAVGQIAGPGPPTPTFGPESKGHRDPSRCPGHPIHYFSSHSLPDLAKFDLSMSRETIVTWSSFTVLSTSSTALVIRLANFLF